MLQNAVQSYQNEMFLEPDRGYFELRLAHVAHYIRSISSGQEGLEVLHPFAERSHISFGLVCHASYDSGGDGVAGVGAEEREEFVFLRLDQRQFLGHALEHDQAHLHARGDIAALVDAFGGHKIVGDGGAGIDDQEVFVGA